MLGNTFGRAFRVTCCGESYGGALLIVCDGVPAGVELAREDVQKDLDRRRPGTAAIASPRQETDPGEIVAGMMDGKTTGAPVGMIIRNVDTLPKHIQQYRDVKDKLRPGHAEYTYYVKYGEFKDWRGAGRASGRETAGRVAGGAVAKKVLLRDGIEVVGYVKECAGVTAREMTFDEIKANQGKNPISCPDLEAAAEMMERIMEIREQGDTCGGILEFLARGVPAGLGEPVFDKLSANIAKGLMSIPSVKGVEIGDGFPMAGQKGSEVNDIPYLKDGKVRLKTNHGGGIDGGISNGEMIVVRMAVKPTSTISIDQDTVDVIKMEKATFGAVTRRDATIAGRAVPVGEAMVAMAILDHLNLWRGADAMAPRSLRFD